MSETKAVRVVIEGRVQGVFFRAWTRERAQALHVAGWVRNRADGAVEAVFSGTSVAVDALVEECRRGPPAAQVQALTTEPAEPLEGGFTVRG